MEYNPKVNLYETDVTNITEIMAGPWKAIKVIDLAPSETLNLDTEDQEHSLFVIEGSFTATTPDGSSFEFVADMALTLPLGDSAKLTAGAAGFKACLVTMRVDH